MGARPGASNEPGSPGGCSSPPECGLCVSAIDETEERCQAACKAGCRSSFHLPCITELVEQAIRAGMAGSRQRKFGEVMLSKVTKRPAEAVKEWLRRPPPPVCPICHVSPLEAAHVHKPSSAKPVRQAAPAAAPAWAPAAHPLPRAGGHSAAGPWGSGHPWKGSSHSYKRGPAPAPARASAFAQEQERQFQEQQAREASLRQQAAAKKEQKAAQEAAQEAARAAVSEQGTGRQVQQAQQAGQGQASSAAGAPAQQKRTVPLSEAALDLMRGHKRRDCARSLRDMGFGASECLQATVAWGGEAESAAAALLEGRTPPGLIATCVAREARELVEAGGRLGLAPTAVEAVLVAMDGDWEQAQRQLRHQVAAASAAASAAALHGASTRSLGGACAGGAAGAGADSLSRSTSTSMATGLTHAQAIYAYAGAHIGGSEWGSAAADDVAAGQYSSLETQALTTASSWPAGGQQQGQALQLWAGAEPAVEPAATGPHPPEPAIAMSEDSARWWAGTSNSCSVDSKHGGPAVAPAAPAGRPVAPAGRQQWNDEAEVADLLELLGLGG